MAKDKKMTAIEWLTEAIVERELTDAVDRKVYFDVIEDGKTDIKFQDEYNTIYLHENCIFSVTGDHTYDEVMIDYILDVQTPFGSLNVGAIRIKHFGEWEEVWDLGSHTTWLTALKSIKWGQHPCEADCIKLVSCNANGGYAVAWHSESMSNGGIITYDNESQLPAPVKRFCEYHNPTTQWSIDN